jgi:hypothetical protein
MIPIPERRQYLCNDQNDNFNFDGKFYGSIQCFSTSCFQLASYLAPWRYQALNDIQLANYIRDILKAHGEAPDNFKDTFTGDVQKIGLQKCLDDAGAKYRVEFLAPARETDLLYGLNYSPVILGTEKLGGLPGGHVVTIINDLGDAWEIADTFGNAWERYRVRKGGIYQYSKDWFRQFAMDKGFYYWIMFAKPEV